MFKVSDMFRHEQEAARAGGNVLPLPERDEMPTRPQRTQPWPHMLDAHQFAPQPAPEPTPVVEEIPDPLPPDVRNEVSTAQEMFVALYPLELAGRERVLKMMNELLALYPRVEPEKAPEHPQGAPV